LFGEAAARAEINDLIQATSKTMLTDVAAGYDANGALHITVYTNSYLQTALGLAPQPLPSGVDGIPLSSADGMTLSSADLARFVKYGDLLGKAGIVGDVLGTALAIGMAVEAYNDNRPEDAAGILAVAMGGLLGGYATGTVTAAGMAALLALPGINVGVLSAMALTGAAAFAGGLVGGLAVSDLIAKLNEDLSNMGVVPFSENIIADYQWALESMGIAPSLLPGHKPNAPGFEGPVPTPAGKPLGPWAPGTREPFDFADGLSSPMVHTRHAVNDNIGWEVYAASCKVA
jgi:hypothetical protein